VTFGRLRRRFRAVAHHDELTPSQMVVLSRLARGAMTAGQLAAAEHVRPQSMAATVAVLLDNGYVEREPDPADRRRHVLSLSVDGRAIIDGTRKARDEWLARAVSERLTEPERETLRAALPLLSRLAE